MTGATLPAGKPYPTIVKALASAAAPKFLKAECEMLERLADFDGKPRPIFALYDKGVGGNGDRYIITGYEGDAK